MSAPMMHTPEPWHAIAWRRNTKTTIISAIDPREPLTINGQIVVQYGHTEIGTFEGSLREGGNEANAARIVACVNALAGISDPVDYRRQADAMDAEIERLNAERDELLAALEEAKNGLLWYRAEFPDAESEADDEAMARIDAAIAKVRP